MHVHGCAQCYMPPPGSMGVQVSGTVILRAAGWKVWEPLPHAIANLIYFDDTSHIKCATPQFTLMPRVYGEK